MKTNKKATVKAILGGNKTSESVYKQELEQFIGEWSITNYYQQSEEKLSKFNQLRALYQQVK